MNPIEKYANDPTLADRLCRALEAEFDKMEKEIKHDVFGQVKSGLTTEYAVAKWLEMHSIHKLRNRLMTKAKQQ